MILSEPRVYIGSAAFAGLRGQRDVVAMPGASPGDVDHYVTGVLGAAHTAQITDLTADSVHTIVAPMRRLLLLATTTGVIVSIVLVLLAAYDAQQRTKSDAARLVVLGADASTASGVQAGAYANGLGIALVAGLAVGLLTATVYDLAGALVAGPGRLGIVIALIGGAVAVLGSATTWLVARAAAPQTGLIGELRAE